MIFISQIIESAMLSMALSVDALTASFAYGAGKIKIPAGAIITITVTCSALLALSVIVGNAAAPFFEKSAAHVISFSVLLILGIVKLFDSMIKAAIKRHNRVEKEIGFKLSGFRFILHIYANPEEADIDRSHTLSIGESAALAAALSMDGLAVGFGAGLASFPAISVFFTSLLICPVAIKSGCALGNSAAHRFKRDLSWVSGVVLIIIALIKL